MKILLLPIMILFILSGCSKKDSGPEDTYSKVSLTKVTILNIQDTAQNGYYWDNVVNGNYPDVYFKLRISNTSTSLFDLSVSDRIENLKASGLPVSWTGSGEPFIVVADLSQKVDVDLFDYDPPAANQYIGTATFNFDNYNTGPNIYPATITETNDSVAVKLDVTWAK